MKSPWAVIAANGLDFTVEAGNVDGNYFTCYGREIVIVDNPTGGALTVLVNGGTDEKNRDVDLAAYSVGAGEKAYLPFGLTNSKGWKDASQRINLVVSGAGLLVGVLRLPAGFPGG
jgi:hypothetical protein